MVRPLMAIDLAIVGPTAAGKSRLAVSLAKTMDAEVISADSRQIYREISIGTGKLQNEEQEGVRHYLIDICSIHEGYSAGDFVRDARLAIQEIRSRGKKVILCGGTGLYLDALMEGLVDLPLRPTGHYEAYRIKRSEVSTEDLYSRLVSLDRTRAESIHPNDRFRLLRALYLLDEFQLPPSEIYEKFRGEGVSCGGVIGLDPGRERLHHRISNRLRTMFENGWIEEVMELLSSGVSPEVPGFNSLGYREVVSYLRGETSKEDLFERVALKTRQYAKRQMTWFRHMAGIRWVSLEEKGDAPLDLSSVYGTIEKISC